MNPQTQTLRITAERLGTVRDVIRFLNDLEFAYNSLYTFNFLVNSLSNMRDKQSQYIDRLLKWDDYNKSNFNRNYLALKYLLDYKSTSLPSLIDLQNIDFEKIVLPEERLIISKVNIQSPGFWEVLGSYSPLEQIREYLKDRHERNKDRAYRNKQEEARGNLELEEKRLKIINKKREILKDLGYSDAEIRQMVSSMVIQPLDQLQQHQDRGQIDGVENKIIENH